MGCSGNTGLKEKKKNKNYIIAELYIDERNINKNIGIISSYEQFNRENKNIEKGKYCSILENEEQIKECEIKINDEIIPFSYYHQFKKPGKYTIIYSFKNRLTNISGIFLN